MAQIIKYSVFDPINISCDQVTKNKAGGNIVYLKYFDQKKMNIQTPYMVSPFGLSTFNDESTGVVKYSVDMSFKGMNEDPKVKEFHDKMCQFDNYMIEKAVENSKEWFGKKYNKEVVSELYRPLVKEAKDPSKYAPTIKYKIRSNADKLNVEAWDEKKNSFDMNLFAPGCKARAIIEVSSIWFVNKQFGCTFTLLQCQVSKPEKIQGFSFQPDSDEEEEEEDEEIEYESEEEEA